MMFRQTCQINIVDIMRRNQLARGMDDGSCHGDGKGRSVFNNVSIVSNWVFNRSTIPKNVSDFPLYRPPYEL